MLPLNHSMILNWLNETDPIRLEQLWFMANKKKMMIKGEQVLYRGIIEFSNYCKFSCTYCGLRSQNLNLSRYHLSESQIIECVKKAKNKPGLDTIVLQSGENSIVNIDLLVRTIKTIREKYNLYVTLMLGELEHDALKTLKKAGANRYLLKFETSNQHLFDKIHPAPNKKDLDNRIKKIKELSELGYEVGSGIMIGIPGQSLQMIADDLILLKELNVKMAALGPYIANFTTPLSAEIDENADIYKNRELYTYKALALARLLLPEANIPATTALNTLNNVSGKIQAFVRGANVLMFNFTPAAEVKNYFIYPREVING